MYTINILHKAKTHSLCNMDTKVHISPNARPSSVCPNLQAEASLLEVNKAAFTGIASCKVDSGLEHAWEALAVLHQNMALGHSLAVARLQMPQASCWSLQASRCFQNGMINEVCFVLSCEYVMNVP